MKPEILFLKQEDVIKAGALDMKMTLDMAEKALKMWATGELINPTKVGLHLPQHESFFISMPTYVGGEDKIAGFKWAIEHQYDYVFEMDADFSHAPADLPRLYQKCAEEGYDGAIGSSYVSGVNVVNWPMGRVLMSYFASKYVRFVTGLPIHDTTAGFKCYRRQVLETIELDKIRFKGYAFQIEMKFTAYQCGFKIAEVPVIFVNRELGTSKMNSSIFGEAFFGVMQLKWSSWFRKYPQKK